VKKQRIADHYAPAAATTAAPIAAPNSTSPISVACGLRGSPGSRNRHPAVTAVTIDASWWRPVSRRTFFAARFGVAIPLVPDANWYSSTGQPAPLHTQVNLALLDVAAEYGVHVPVHPRVALTGRVGLGLAICKGLIEAMGGSIRAEAAWPDDSGTRIVVALPLFNPEAA